MEIAACIYPDTKDHGANMGPIWGRQDPGGPHVGPIDFAVWVIGQQAHLFKILQSSVVITWSNI